MNTIGLLLVLGLAFFAMKQKSEKTRNMLLVVSALLGFCMFSAEGFTDITFTQAADGTADPTAGNSDAASNPSSITVGGKITSADGVVYTFPAGFSVTTGTPVPTYSCDGEKEPGTPGPVTGSLSDSTVAAAYPCNDTTEPTPDQSVTGDEADPCKCLTATEGNNLYCNSGWMNPDLLEYMGDDGETAPDYASAATCWEGSLDFIPTLGGMFTGRCTKRKDSSECPGAADDGL